MSSEWEIVKLGTLADFQEGYVNPSQREPAYFDGPVKWLRATDLNDGFVANTSRTLSDKGFRSAGKSALLFEPGTLAISKSGTIGRLGILGDYMCGNRAVINIRPKANAVPRYLFFILRHLRPTIEVLAEGSVQKNLYVSTLSNLDVPAPPLEIQKILADILGSLDDRIILLRETNTTLEAIAQALFKSWFVDFDPVRAKMEGRIPEGMDAATAALFPDSFEESELGLVPSGWRVKPLPEVFDFKEGPGIRNWQYTNSDQGTRFINIRCIQNGDLTIESANRISDEEANGKYAHFHLSAWDVVVSTSGTLGRSAIVRQEHLPLMLNTSVIRFRPIDGQSVFSFVYQYLNGSEFLFKLESMASGSVQKNFGPMHLKQINLVTPPFTLLQAYDDIVRPLYEKVIQNRAQEQILGDLRDTVLPRLISGQLRLSETQAGI